MKRTVLLRTAALLITVAAAKAQDDWVTIDSWQYAPKSSAVACTASANSSGTLFVGGRALNGTVRPVQLGVIKAYNPGDVIGQTGGSVLFASPGTLNSVAAGANGDVYFTGTFPDAEGVNRWTVAHCNSAGVVTRYVQADGSGGVRIAFCPGKVVTVGSLTADATWTMRVFEVNGDPSHLSLLSDVRLLTPDGRKMHTRGIVAIADRILVAGNVVDQSNSDFTDWLVASSTDYGANWSIIDEDTIPSFGANALTLDGPGNIYACGYGPGYTWQVRMYVPDGNGGYSRTQLDTYLLQPSLVGAEADGIAVCGGGLYVAGSAWDYDPVPPPKKNSPPAIHNTWVTRKAYLLDPDAWTTSDFYWPAFSYPGGWSYVTGMAATADRVFVVGAALELYPKAGRSPTQADRWIVRALAPAP